MGLTISPPHYIGRGRNAGYVEEAAGLVGIVGSVVKGAYVNANRAYGLKTYFLWPRDSDAWAMERLNSNDGNCESADQCLSIVRRLTFLATSEIVDITDQDCGGSLVANSTGLLVYDTIPNSGGGLEINTPYLVDSFSIPREDIVHPIEQRMGIVNRGDTILGDGVAGSTRTEETGYDSDVVHIRDVIHLSPRTAPPEISKNMAPSDRAGLLYFDAARGTLRVSVPIRGEEYTESSSWHEDAVAWVDLSLNMASIRPEDIVLNNIDTLDPRKHFDAVNFPKDGGPTYQGYIKNGLAKAAAEAQGESATSPYIAPGALVHSIEQVSDGLWVAKLKVTGFRRLYASGDGPKSPEVHFCVKNRISRDEIFTSRWSLSADVYVSDAPPPTGLTKHPGDEFYDAYIVSEDIKVGSTICLMVIDPESAESFGTSYVIQKED